MGQTIGQLSFLRILYAYALACAYVVVKTRLYLADCYVPESIQFRDISCFSKK